MLVDDILDALAATRNNVRVAPYKNEANGKFLVTLLIEIPPAAYKKLCDEAAKQDRSPAKVLRRYVVGGLRDCFAEDMEEAA